MISIQQRLFLTDQSKKEGKEFEPLRPTTEEEFIALSNSEELLKRAQMVEALADDWWAEPDEAKKRRSMTRCKPRSVVCWKLPCSKEQRLTTSTASKHPLC